MASSGSPQEMTWVKSARPSSGPFVKVYPEDADETFAKGDPVILTSTGTVKLGTEAGSTFGIAAQDATGTTSSPIKVIVASDDDVFRASQSTSGATQASTQAMVGLQCGYIKSTITGKTTKTVVDTAEVTEKHIEILGLRDAVGTSEGEVYFRFIRAKISAR